MPRRLLRDGRIVDDEWRYATDDATAAAAAAAAMTGNASAPLIVGFDRWQAERDSWLSRGGRLGVLLAPADKVELLAPDLARLSLVAAEFSGPAEGRGYTQARLLRERYRFTGELRAAGFVRRDQLFFLARCGFNSFELPEGELHDAQSALATFSAAYQPTNDAGLPLTLQRRLPDTPASA